MTADGGLELLLNCVIASAAPSARIGNAHLNFGEMGAALCDPAAWRKCWRVGLGHNDAGAAYRTGLRLASMHCFGCGGAPVLPDLAEPALE